MTEYYNTKTEKLVTVSQIKGENPNVSFPSIITAETVASLGYSPVVQTDKPTATSNLKYVITDGVESKDGEWKLKWKEVDLHSDYEDAEGKTVTKATQDTAYLTSIDNNKATTNRNNRNKLLAETDFYALSDVTLSDDMKTYRQALRDLTKNSSWPNLSESDWPTKP
jgi:hypothetical protein